MRWTGMIQTIFRTGREGSLMTRQNKTAHDAFVRVFELREGMLVDASDEFIEELTDLLEISVRSLKDEMSWRRQQTASGSRSRRGIDVKTEQEKYKQSRDEKLAALKALGVESLPLSVAAMFMPDLPEWQVVRLRRPYRKKKP